MFLGISASLFTTLLLALGGAITLMYLVKLRRRRVQVPYGVLWERLLVERRARSLWHRVKRWLSLLLQLLILALLLLALRDPRPVGEADRGHSVLLLVDTSASMASLDGPAGADRMEAARHAALEIFDELTPEDSLMVVRADGQIRPLTPFVRPNALVREQLSRLDYTASRTDLAAALRFAARSLTGRAQPELVLVTDGAFSADELERAAAVELPAGVRARVVTVGERGGNVAITAFNVRSYPEDRRNYEVFLEVSNSFDSPVTVELTLTANDLQVDRRLLEVPAQGRVERSFANLARGGDRLRAEVTIVAGDAVDLFPVDDRAYALLPDDRRLRVLLVSRPNLFIEAPLLLNQSLGVVVRRPDELAEGTIPDASDFDVIVLNDVDLAPPDEADVLILHPRPGTSPWEVRGTRTDPIIDRFDRNDPLMRWIHGFRSVNIAQAAELRVTDADVVAARSIGGDPMFVRRIEPTRRLVGVAFPIDRSDFGLRVGYPLFVLNAIDWLTQEDSPLIESYATGRAARIRVGPGDRAWLAPLTRLPSDDGWPRQVDVVDGFVTLYPEHPGFYAIVVGRDQDDPEALLDGLRAGTVSPARVVAANLTDEAESDLTPVRPFPIGEAGPSETVDRTSLLSRREPWMLLVLLAVALLTLEWVTFNRRVTV